MTQRLALIAAIFLSGCSQSRTAGQLLPNDAIAFVRHAERGSDIYVIAPDGSGERRVTHSREPKGELTWSPDGRMLAYVRSVGFGPTHGNSDVFVVNLIGPEIRLTHDPESEFQPAWSPDGKRIAYKSWSDGTPQIWLVDVDGSNRRQLTRAASLSKERFLGPSTDPAWSPDGTRIAFSRHLIPFSDVSALSHIGADGSGETRITDGDHVDRAPVWSKDGSSIFFARGDEIFVIDREGSNLRRLITIEDMAGTAWSPDGSRLATIRDREEGINLWIVKADGSDMRPLTKADPDVSERSFAWASDGSAIVLERLTGVQGPPPGEEPREQEDGDGVCHLFIVNVDGSGERQLTNAHACDGDTAWARSV